VAYQVSGNLVLGLILLTVLVAIPVKIGAHVVKAKYTGLVRCGFAAFVGLLGVALVALFLGGLIGGSLACALGFLLTIRAMLGTSFLGSIALSLIAFMVSAMGVWVLARIGLLLAAPVATGVAV
jgi:hypothetical protein